MTGTLEFSVKKHDIKNGGFKCINVNVINE